MKLALFDLDHTLLPIDSDHAWGEFVIALGWADGPAQRQANDAFYQQYQRGALDIHAYVEFATRAWRHRPAAEQAAAHARFMRERILPAVRPEALALVREEAAAGALLAVVTATNDFITRPIATAFGVETLLAVELERDAAGAVTGRIRGVPSYQAGKAERVRQWLAGMGRRPEDFERITAYGDSINDLALLELATHPVATNPSPALAAIAAERGWPTLHLFP